MEKFRKHQASALAEANKRREEREEEDRKRREKRLKKEEAERKRLEDIANPPKILEVTDEEAEQIQKDIDQVKIIVIIKQPSPPQSFVFKIATTIKLNFCFLILHKAITYHWGVFF